MNQIQFFLLYTLTFNFSTRKCNYEHVPLEQQNMSETGGKSSEQSIMNNEIRPLKHRRTHPTPAEYFKAVYSKFAVKSSVGCRK